MVYAFMDLDHEVRAFWTSLSLSLCIYVYIYISICRCIYIYIYVYGFPGSMNVAIAALSRGFSLPTGLQKYEPFAWEPLAYRHE